MKEITIRLKCNRCSFRIKHPVYTNKYGYFTITQMQCPNDLSALSFEIWGLPIDTTEVENGDKRRS